MARVPSSERLEQYVLRIEVTEVAEKLRQLLQSDSEETSVAELVKLQFESEDQGSIEIEGCKYPVWLRQLPTHVESYKTLNDIDCVKTADITQMLIVRSPGSDPPPQTLTTSVTPPMENAAQRHFRDQIKVPSKLVANVEQQLLTILKGEAPPGWTFIDQLEECEIDKTTGNPIWRKTAKSYKNNNPPTQ
eukprot:TRINITY_DN20445_c0_g1_i1.p2 TRINITY_DN20445_c0_g1~~TRINITY_DN20445_c0_g1_i1.p2  ORF type:complete len:190 (+),score=20.16 TRINITY_DN20445_c0_g1_i1:128-697(+)